jgi:flagellar biosynthesis/type III secretory pathway chaperone
MENLLKELIDILENQANLYRSLLSVLTLEKNAVVGAKLDTLNAARLQKESIVSSIDIGEKKRMDIIDKICDYLKCPSQGMTLSHLAQRIASPYSMKLIQYADEISSIGEDIYQKNELNKSLLRHSLKLVRSSIDLLVQMMTPSPVYFRTGKMYQGEICGAVLSNNV